MSEEINPESIWQIANEYNDGDVIMLVEGTLTKLYPEKPTPHGTIQNGELTDSEGNMCKVTFADVSQPVTARNQYIALAATHSQQHGNTGVKVKDDPQYGRAIWVTPSATITYPNGAPAAPQQRQQAPPRQQQRAPQQQARKPQQQARQPQQPQQRQPQGGQRQPTGGGNNQPPAPQTRTENQYEAVERFASCYFYVHNLVNEKLIASLPEDTRTNTVFTMDLTTRIAATVFVDVAKSGVANHWNPNLKVRQFPLPPSDPRDWKECYIENDKSALNGKTLAEISDDELAKLHDYYDGKKANHALAECVYQAAIDRKIFKQEEPQGKALDPDLDNVDQDDIPF